MGKEKKISREDIAKMSREERMKYEIAQELGLQFFLKVCYDKNV